MGGNYSTGDAVAVLACCNGPIFCFGQVIVETTPICIASIDRARNGDARSAKRLNNPAIGRCDLTLPHGGTEIMWTILGVAVLALGHDLNYRASR